MSKPFADSADEARLPFFSTELRPIVIAIDQVSDGICTGWLHDFENPRRKLTLHGVIDGSAQVEAIANLYRADLVPITKSDGNCGFALELPRAVTGFGSRRLQLRVAGTDRLFPPTPLLIGHGWPESDAVSISTIPPDTEGAERFQIRIEKSDQHQLRGWAVDSSRPSNTFFVDVLVDGTQYMTVPNSGPRADLKKAGKSSGLGGIALDFPRDMFSGGKHHVSMRAPDGKTVSAALDCSPVADNPRYAPPVERPQNVSIVIPIFNATEDLKECLARLFKFTTVPCRLILVDDCSSDPEIANVLAKASTNPNVSVLVNEHNLGFSRSVNRGIEAAGIDDVVLLNSDARVTPRWLEGLLDAAACDPRIGTVTPLSDRAGAFSAPSVAGDNPLPPGISEPDFAIAVRRRANALYPSVPTGNGFCMFLRRALLHDVGVFDAIAFPRGYGEENDLCMRAGNAGWRHVIDDRTYVFHERSKSFGSEKNELAAAGRKVVNERYPGYSNSISVFSKDTRVALARFRVGQAAKDFELARPVLPRAVFVVSTQTGGTPQTNNDLMGELRSSWETWLLQCDSKIMTLSRFSEVGLEVIRRHTLDEPVQAVTHSSFEYEAVISSWLKEYEFDLVHIRHLGWHCLSLPRKARESGAAVVLSLHDFYTICPTVKLLDETGVFCGGECTKSDGECQIELWPNGSMPKIKGAWVKNWRVMFDAILEHCDALVTTSDSARQTLSKYLPSARATDFHVVPHGRTFAHFESTLRIPDGRLKILVPGDITFAKGRDIIEGLLKLDVDERLEFHVLGKIDATAHHPRIVEHGPYGRDSFVERVKNIAPNVGAVFSIWDETWCHTLTELWAAGLPAMVLNFPTVTGRVHKSGGGWVYAREDLSHLYQQIVADGFNPDELFAKHLAVHRWQRTEARSNSTRLMAARYEAIYGVAIQRRAADARAFGSIIEKPAPLRPVVAVVCPANADLKGANASTHIRIWERTRNSSTRSAVFVRMSAAELLAAAYEGDIGTAIVQRNAIPPTVWPDLKRAILDGRINILLDLDDDLMAVSKDKDCDGAYINYRSTLGDIIPLAAQVTVSTPELYERIKALNPSISLLENSLSERLWAGPPRQRVRDGMVRALYFGSKTHDGDLDFIWPALEAVSRQWPNFRLRLIGVLGRKLDNVPTWLEISEVPESGRNYPDFVSWMRAQATEVDFGLAPLEDTNFNLAKSPLKLFEYAALNLPVLVSDSPVYNDVAATSPLARTVLADPEEWRVQIDRLIQKSHSTAGERTVVMKNWVMANHALGPTLEAFDSMISCLIQGSV